jgi:hypothetical protein
MICEVHITVDARTDEAEFAAWCQAQNFKAIKAVSEKGDYPVQPMIGKYISGTVPECIDRMKRISGDITGAGFKVVRDKLEISCGGPDALKYFDVVKDGLYFESHFKIKSDEEHRLGEILDRHPMTGQSVNVLSKTSKMPLVTVRLPCGTYTWNDLVQQTNSLCAELLDSGLTVEDKKHFELAVYDDNRDMDKNWLAYT